MANKWDRNDFLEELRAAHGIGKPPCSFRLIEISYRPKKQFFGPTYQDEMEDKLMAE